jgi:hypothetical protein
MKDKKSHHYINEISKFLAVRDIAKLDSVELEKVFGIRKVDVLILLGCSC